MRVSRRHFIATTTVAGAGLLMPQRAGAEGSAAANGDKVRKGAVENPGFFRFMLGDLEITTLSDGRRSANNPEKIYGIDQDPKVVAALLEENLLPTGHLVNGFTPVLIRTGGELILFDTGLGAGARDAGQGRLIEQLKASGVMPEDVTLVALTHFHDDHIGGLMENDRPSFPNARYAFGRKEFDFWTDPARLDSPQKNNAALVAKNVKPLADKAVFLDDRAELVPGIQALAAYGHTPGHLIFRVTASDGRTLMLTGDTVNHFVLSLQRPDWHVAFDMDKEMAAQTRKRVLDMIATDRLPFIGYHMPFPALAYVQKNGDSYRYVPETYQLREI